MCVGFMVDKVCCKDYSVSCFNTELLNSYTCYVNADDAVPHCAHVDPEILMPFWLLFNHFDGQIFVAIVIDADVITATVL